MRILIWGATCVYMAVIAYLSHDPAATEGLPLAYGMDKVVHIMEFGLLGVLLFGCCKAHPKWAGMAVPLALCIGIAYAGLDEWHQSFVPGRVSSVWDFLADAIGVTLAVRVCNIRWQQRIINTTN